MISAESAFILHLFVVTACPFINLKLSFFKCLVMFATGFNVFTMRLNVFVR